MASTDLELIKQLLGFVRSNYKTRKGFFASFLLILLTLNLPVSALIQLTIEHRIYAGVAIVFLHTIVWSLKSGFLILPSKKTIVAIAVEAEGKAYYHLKSIITQVRNQLRDLGLSPNFLILHLAHDRFKMEISNAHKYRESRGITLLIWGSGGNLKDKGKEVTPFKLYFTFPTGIIRRDQMKLLSLDAGLFLQDKKWLVYDEDTYTYTVTVTNDLLEVSLFILGISNLLTNRLEDGIILLERVKLLLNSRTQLTDILEAKKGRVNAILLSTLWVLFRNICLGKQTEKEFKIIKKVLELDPKSLAANLEMARIQFLRGHTDDSKQYNKRAYAVDRRNPLLLFNFAFFAILEKKYDSAIRFYNRIVLRKDIETNFPAIIEFLGECYDRDNTEKAYLFAMGAINLFYLDGVKGRIELGRFLNVAGDEQYKGMKDKAQQFLDQAKKSLEKEKKEKRARKKKNRSKRRGKKKRRH
jgi:hypothetical protein